MEKGKFQIIGLQACFWVTLIPILLIVSPAHSHVVRRDAVNKLCGDDRLYFKETRKCYPANWKGPCGELMVLEPSDKDKNIGECNCEVPDRSTYCPQRPKVFWEKESRCYYIYDQGLCKNGEWIVPHKDNGPSCERITCPERYEAQLKEKYYTTNSNRFIFLHEGKCHQAYSQEGGFCRPEEYVFFIGGDSLNLHCSKGLACGISISPVKDCPDDSKPDSQGGCEPIMIL